MRERKTPDAGDAVGDCVACGFSSWTLDECGLGLVEQNPVQTAVTGIQCIHGNCHQAGAEKERTVPDAGNAVADRHAGKAGAVLERPGSDVGDAVGNSDAE